MEKITVNSTKKKYLIVNQFGDELGVITIDPSDVNILKRSENAKKNIIEYIDEATKIAGTMNDEDAMEELDKIDKKIKHELNAMFDYDVSSIFFGQTHCLSTSGGITFIENFLDAVIPVIEKEFEKEIQAASDRIDKYTARYHQ